VGGFVVEPCPTKGPGDATALARRAVAQGAEVAFALGGDGTLRETAAGLLGSDVALGALPAGTANVLALALGIPRNALAAAKALAGGGRRTIDVGLVGEEPFLMMASCGLDSEVMAHQSPWWKKRFGRAAFGTTMLKQWWTYDYPEVEVRHAAASVKGTFVAVCNAPYFGGRFQMVPEAEMNDGRLDAVVFRGRGRLATLGFTLGVALGRHLRRPDVEAMRVEEVTIDAPPGVRLQIDGDVLAAAPPFTIRMSENRLSVLLPAES
jgi:YegS/Rv2252/BmrU family lipid kinase